MEPERQNISMKVSPSLSFHDRSRRADLMRSVGEPAMHYCIEEYCDAARRTRCARSAPGHR